MESTPLHLFFFIVFFVVLSRVISSPLFPHGSLPTSSGYFPVGDSSSVSGDSRSAMFYVYYEAQHPTTALSLTPLLIWLQGGPGCSSMIGNFNELGPWRLSANGSLNPNPAPWNRLFGLLFLDSPIGSGFSIAASPRHIPSDQPAVSAHLFAALRSFLSSNPSFASRPLFLTGESYAGKYVPAFGYYILQQNSKLPASHRINLQGVAIGNGLTHPVAQVATHAAQAYYTGLINDRQRAKLEKLQANAVRLTREGKNWSEATDARNSLLNWLKEKTGLPSLYDFRLRKPDTTGDQLSVFLNKYEVKEALGVGRGLVWEGCSDLVGKVLHADVMKSVKYMVEELLKKSRVLLYQGQFDLRDGVVSTEAWVKELEWEGLERFLMADRRVWNVNGELSGYVQRWGGLTHVVVGGAGHFVPADQAESSQAMIEGWVQRRGLFGGDE